MLGTVILVNSIIWCALAIALIYALGVACLTLEWNIALVIFGALAIATFTELAMSAFAE